MTDNFEHECTEAYQKQMGDIIELLRESPKNSVVLLLGAGISVSAGIPDFRTPEVGLFSCLSKYNLRHPTDIFEYSNIIEDPRPFYHIIPHLESSAAPQTGAPIIPTITHYLIYRLAKLGLLKRVYTQNIDGLEYKFFDQESEQAQRAAEYLIIQAHGGLRSGSCMNCKRMKGEKRVEHIPTELFVTAAKAGDVVHCQYCGCLCKPNVVMYSEDLPEEFNNARYQKDGNGNTVSETSMADTIIVIGTSLAVSPFNNLIGLDLDKRRHDSDDDFDYNMDENTHTPHTILINLTPVRRPNSCASITDSALMDIGGVLNLESYRVPDSYSCPNTNGVLSFIYGHSTRDYIPMTFEPKHTLDSLGRDCQMFHGNRYIRGDKIVSDLLSLHKGKKVETKIKRRIEMVFERHPKELLGFDNAIFGESDTAAGQILDALGLNQYEEDKKKIRVSTIQTLRPVTEPVYPVFINAGCRLVPVLATEVKAVVEPIVSPDEISTPSNSELDGTTRPAPLEGEAGSILLCTESQLIQISSMLANMYEDEVNEYSNIEAIPTCTVVINFSSYKSTMTMRRLFEIYVTLPQMGDQETASKQLVIREDNLLFPCFMLHVEYKTMEKSNKSAGFPTNAFIPPGGHWSCYCCGYVGLRGAKIDETLGGKRTNPDKPELFFDPYRSYKRIMAENFGAIQDEEEYSSLREEEEEEEEEDGTSSSCEENERENSAQGEAISSDREDSRNLQTTEPAKATGVCDPGEYVDPDFYDNVDMDVDQDNLDFAADGEELDAGEGCEGDFIFDTHYPYGVPQLCDVEPPSDREQNSSPSSSSSDHIAPVSNSRQSGVELAIDSDSENTCQGCEKSVVESIIDEKLFDIEAPLPHHVEDFLRSLANIKLCDSRSSAPFSQHLYADEESMSLMPAGPCFGYNRDDQWLVLSPDIVVEKRVQAQQHEKEKEEEDKKKEAERAAGIRLVPGGFVKLPKPIELEVGGREGEGERKGKWKGRRVANVLQKIKQIFQRSMKRLTDRTGRTSRRGGRKEGVVKHGAV